MLRWSYHNINSTLRQSGGLSEKWRATTDQCESFHLTCTSYVELLVLLALLHWRDLCRLGYIFLSEHNQVVLLQIKSVASLWPEICPHPLGNTYSSVLNASTHTRTHTYSGNCRRLHSDSSCSDVNGQQSNKNQLLPSPHPSLILHLPRFSSSSSPSSSCCLHLSFFFIPECYYD